LQFDAQFPVEAVEIGEREHAFDFDVVGLLETIPVLEELRGEVAVVGEEDQTGGRIFEIADGVDAIGKAAEKIPEGFAAFGVGERGDDFGRLVEKEIDVAGSSSGDVAASGFDFVVGGVGFGAEGRDGFAVDANLAREDELLGVAAGCDPGAGDDFLEAFEHGEF
jgi:hypothetical protein